ncbi:MAG TPA: uroporphyrinogen-III synthase [Methanosarcinales archaeon]|nr:uroporphyrinogen-III synthase [Methanosarcinales archaeon]
MEKPIIAIMRPDMHLDSSVALLHSRGFDVIAAPMIELRDNHDGNFDGFVERVLACESDIVIFTSANGIAFMLQKIDDPERFVHTLNQTSVVAIGSKTKRALETRSINVSLMPDSYSSKGIADMLRGTDNKTVEVVRSTHGDPALITELRSSGDGVLVHETAVYKLVLPDDGRQQRMIEDALNRKIDVFAFTSAMTVHNFMTVARSMGAEEEIVNVLCERVVAAIGDPTADVLSGYGVSVDVMPEKFTFEDMVDAIMFMCRQTN